MQVPGLDAVGHHVRAAAKLAPGRPAVWLGLRVTLATAGPLIASAVLPVSPVAAAWAPLAGFVVALVDKGGAYRSRAIAMTSVGLGATVAVAAGSALAGHGLVTATLVALMLALAAFGQAWGPAMISFGNTIAIQMLVAASLPCPLADVHVRALGTLGGATFAIVLGLIVWPVRVYKPGRQAMSSVLAALAAHARALAQAPAHDAAWRDELVRRHRGIRDQIEAARIVLAGTRRGRRGESGRGERLLAMAQLADQLFGILTGLEEVLEAGHVATARAEVATSLTVLADSLAELSSAVLAERTPPIADRPWTPAAVAPTGTSVDDVLAAQAQHLLVRAHDDRALILALIRSLEDESEPLPTALPDPEPRPRFTETLRSALDRDSIVWRHALRVFVVVAVAMAVARELDLSHRYYVTLTAYLLLQPAGAATRIKAVQRVGGTVIGGVIAAAIPYAVADPRALMVIVVVFAGMSASVLSLNYGLYAMFLTPTFVLLAEIHATDPHLIWVRIGNTLLGASIAMVGSAVWRAKESTRFDDQVADAYECVARYLAEVVDAVANHTPQPSRKVVGARRSFGVALNHAELALDRLVAERAPTDVIEPRMTQLVFLRRLGSAITVFGGTRAGGSYAAHAVPIAAFGAAAIATLHDLANALRQGTTPAARPRLERALDDAVLAARLARIDRAIATLAEAVIRAHGIESAMVARA